MPLRGSLRGFCGVSSGLYVARGSAGFSEGSDPILGYGAAKSKIIREEISGVRKRAVSKRVVLADVPPERKPERGYIRQNHPFTKPPFYLPAKIVQCNLGPESKLALWMLASENNLCNALTTIIVL